MLDFWEGYFDFIKIRGYLWTSLHVFLLICAVLSFATATLTWFAKVFLIGEVVDVLVYAVYFWLRNKKAKKKDLAREDSFWLKKDESNEKNEEK